DRCFEELVPEMGALPSRVPDPLAWLLVRRNGVQHIAHRPLLRWRPIVDGGIRGFSLRGGKQGVPPREVRLRWRDHPSWGNHTDVLSVRKVTNVRKRPEEHVCWGLESQVSAHLRTVRPHRSSRQQNGTP